MDRMWKKIDDFVNLHHMIGQGDRIVIGLSGGSDSIFLSRYLLHLKEKKNIFLCAVHVNHQLRGEEAERDEDFVKDFCRKWEIPLFVFREDVTALAKDRKCSLEEAGRIARYRCFRDCARQQNCSKIALAHHAADQAETMLFRIIRGTGPEGLSGILPVNGDLIRPILETDKRDIMRDLEQMRQEYVVDSTNGDTDYSRNYIRHHILPKMCEINKAAITHFSTLSGQLSEQNQYLKKKMDGLYEEHVVREEEGVRMSKNFLEHCEPYEQKEMIRRMIFQAAGHRRDVTFVHVKDLLDLLGKKEANRIDLPYGLTACLFAQSLYVGKIIPKPVAEGIHYDILPDHLGEGECFRLPINDNISLCFQITSSIPLEFPKNDCVKYFDYAKIVSGLCVRTRHAGDYFVMDASGRRKKLKRYFIDRKMSREERESTLLLAQGNHILWIIGDRISEEYKVTSQTKTVLKVWRDYHERKY